MNCARACVCVYVCFKIAPVSHVCFHHHCSSAQFLRATFNFPHQPNWATELYSKRTSQNRGCRERMKHNAHYDVRKKDSAIHTQKYRTTYCRCVQRGHSKISKRSLYNVGHCRLDAQEFGLFCFSLSGIRGAKNRPPYARAKISVKLLRDYRHWSYRCVTPAS